MAQTMVIFGAGHMGPEPAVAFAELAHRARLITHNDAIGIHMVTVSHPSATIVCRGTFLTGVMRVGSATLVDHGVVLGHDGVVGGAVVVRDIAPDTTVVGVPAAPLRAVR